MTIIQYECDNEGGVKSSNIHIDRMISSTHVAYVEVVVRVIKERVSCTRLSIIFHIEGDLLNHLLTNVVLWMNLLPRASMCRSSFEWFYGLKPDFNRIADVAFGDVVICYNHTINKHPGVPNGELGMCVGHHPFVNTGIVFLSFSTGHTKFRNRFQIVVINAGLERYGINTSYINQAYVPYSTALADGHQLIVDTVAKRFQIEHAQSLTGDDMVMTNDIYSVIAHSSHSWKYALKTYHQDDALKAINAEINNQINFKTFKPVHLKTNEVKNYFRCHEEMTMNHFYEPTYLKIL